MKKNYPFLLLFIFLLIINVSTRAQVGIGTTTPAASAQLDVNSTTKGLLPPRMTTMQRDAITSPANGLIIFNTTTNGLQIKTSSGWVSLMTPSTTPVCLPTTVIGAQQWMSKNLDVAFYRNGDPIPQVTDDIAWASSSTGAWCYYNFNPIYGGIYGKLYNWYAVNDPRGLAPVGWHIPDYTEWTFLESSLGGALVAGGRLKEFGTAHWASPNTGGTNNSGFTALPGGYCGPNGIFINISSHGQWWTSSGSIGGGVASYFFLSYYSAASLSSDGALNSGFYVRCVRDSF
jgi:uncharacterized protein (TIGR02145 family)